MTGRGASHGEDRHAGPPERALGQGWLHNLEAPRNELHIPGTPGQGTEKFPLPGEVRLACAWESETDKTNNKASIAGAWLRFLQDRSECLTRRPAARLKSRWRREHQGLENIGSVGWGQGCTLKVTGREGLTHKALGDSAPAPSWPGFLQDTRERPAEAVERARQDLTCQRRPLPPETCPAPKQQGSWVTHPACECTRANTRGQYMPIHRPPDREMLQSE